MILALAFGRTITAREAVAEFGVSAPRLVYWRKRGLLQAVRVGRSYRYSRDEIIRMLTFGEDWMGRVHEPGTHEAGRIRRAAADRAAAGPPGVPEDEDKADGFEWG